VREAVKPIIYAVPPVQTTGFRQIREASVRVSGRNLDQTLAHIDAMWREFVPDQPVTRRFLDQDFEALYRGERRQAQMFTLFALLAIVVACLGLFGLAAFTTSRRTKEIGLRKTLGARVGDIVRLFSGVRLARAAREPARMAGRLCPDATLARDLRLPHRARCDGVRRERPSGVADRLGDGRCRREPRGAGQTGNGTALRVIHAAFRRHNEG
jgi:hypothetical protein